MHTYKVTFWMNGKQREETVTARNEFDAKELVTLRYKGEKLTNMFAKRVD